MAVASSSPRPTAVRTPSPVPTTSASPSLPLPAGWSVSLAPFGTFPRRTVEALAKFYLVNYGIKVKILPAAAVSAAARDPHRRQLVAEELIASLKGQYPKLVADPRAAIIGLVTEDLYIRSRVDWHWAFGLRLEDRYGVVSSARMAFPGNATAAVRMTRLRKMVTRYVGFLYFGLPANDKPKSVLYADIGGIDDLDRVGETF
jgi:predicted Zn-dependent protease